MSDLSSVEKLRAYCKDREQQTDAVGATARFLSGCAVSGFTTIDDVKTGARHYGPNVTMAEIDAAVSAAGIAS